MYDRTKAIYMRPSVALILMHDLSIEVDSERISAPTPTCPFAKISEEYRQELKKVAHSTSVKGSPPI
jgi:hypothetical protein